MSFYTIEAAVIIALLVLGAIWIAATWKEPFWHWYYDGVLGGVPPPGDRGAPGAVHVSASSRVSNSAPSSSAATVHVKSASGTVRSQTPRISRKEYRRALSRMQRKA